MVFAVRIDPIVGIRAVRLVKLAGGGVVALLHAQSVITPIVGHMLLRVHAFDGTLVGHVIPLLRGRHHFLMLLEALIHALPKRLAIGDRLRPQVRVELIVLDCQLPIEVRPLLIADLRPSLQPRGIILGCRVDCNILMVDSSFPSGAQTTSTWARQKLMRVFCRKGEDFSVHRTITSTASCSRILLILNLVRAVAASAK